MSTLMRSKKKAHTTIAILNDTCGNLIRLSQLTHYSCSSIKQKDEVYQGKERSLESPDVLLLYRLSLYHSLKLLIEYR